MCPRDVPRAPPPGSLRDGVPGSVAPPSSMRSASYCPSRARSSLMEEDRLALGPSPTSFHTPVLSGLFKSGCTPCRGSDMVLTPATGPVRHLRLLLFLALLCRPIRLLHRCRLTCICLPKTTHQNKHYILRFVATLKHSMEKLHIVHVEELYLAPFVAKFRAQQAVPVILTKLFLFGGGLC